MISQPSLFEDPTIDRDVSIKKVMANANEAWKKHAIRVLNGIAYRSIELTSNDVEKAMEGSGLSTHDKRAMGGVMRYGEKMGWIAHFKPRKFKTSTSRKSHRCPREVWRSLLYRA